MKSFVCLTTLVLAFSIFAPPEAHAIRIQILHTNDLHASILSHGTPNKGDAEYGGWAQIKTAMDKLTADALDHKNPDGTPDPIETLRLDAGDFMEGTMDYFPDSGKDVIRAFQAMGYDAVTLGNHDWLMGARSLNQVFGEVPFSKTQILSSNLDISKQVPHLQAQIRPDAQFVRGGLKINVFGLSTNEAFYSWITRIGSKPGDLKLQDYIDDDVNQNPGDEDYNPAIATREIQKLYGGPNNLVVALTHIGYENDKILAASTRGLDLIIGGHSHTILESWTQVTDLDGNSIPIVQTGVNGRYIGKIMIDYTPGAHPVVSTYELVEVPHETTPDPTIAKLVQKAEDDLKAQYPAMDEVIGKSDVRLIPGDRSRTAFSKFAADAMRSQTKADLAIDIGLFHGVTPQPAGDVTRRNLMEMYPRKFETTQNEGLYVYTTWVSGLVLKLAVQFAVKYGFYLAVSGMHYDVTRISDDAYNQVLLEAAKHGEMPSTTPYRASNFKIDHFIFCDHCIYRVAMPESFIRGIYSFSGLTKLILRDGIRTDVTIWDAMVNHLKEIGTIRALGISDRLQNPEYTLPSNELRLSGEESDPLPWVTGEFDMQLFMNSILKETHDGADVMTTKPSAAHAQP